MKRVFKIKLDNIKLNKKNLLIGISISIVTILLIVAIVIGINKSKTTSSDNIEEMGDVEQVTINEEVGEYVDIGELEQNIVEEEVVQEVENTQKDNVTNNKTNSTSNKNTTSGTPYYIKVNYGAQVVTVYKKDAQGNYKAMVCSTGVATPKSGVYKIQSRWEWLRLEGYVFGHYSTQITGNILFHSVPYLEKGNLGSIEYWEYDKLGTYASAGCVRLTVADALWIFNNCARGTKVEFYSSSNPGPLGKPSAKKISNANGDLKNWDPTDPNPNNPWKNYKPEENKNTNTTVDKNNSITNTEKNNNQISNNEIENNKTNTQVNEIKNNEVSKNETNNEIVNEVNSNTTKENKIDTNETKDEVVNEVANDKNTNTTKQNEESKNNKVNEEEQ